jgi:hypothetical protein
MSAPTGFAGGPKKLGKYHREMFHIENEPVINAPTRVTFQQLTDGSFVLHNYNQNKIKVEIQLPAESKWMDRFTGKPLETSGKLMNIEMTPRSIIWCESVK